MNQLTMLSTPLALCRINSHNAGETLLTIRFEAFDNVSIDIIKGQAFGVNAQTVNLNCVRDDDVEPISIARWGSALISAHGRSIFIDADELHLGNQPAERLHPIELLDTNVTIITPEVHQ